MKAMKDIFSLLNTGIYVITSINKSLSGNQKEFLKIGLGDLSGNTFDVAILMLDKANKFSEYLIKGQMVSVTINRGVITSLSRPKYWELKEYANTIIY